MFHNANMSVFNWMDYTCENSIDISKRHFTFTLETICWESVADSTGTDETARDVVTVVITAVINSTFIDIYKSKIKRLVQFLFSDEKILLR